MIGLPTGLIFGFLIALIYAFLFHLFIGGNLWRLVIYLIASLIGFGVGHYCGLLFGPNSGKIGMLYTQYATIGSILTLISSHLLITEGKSAEKRK